jgi:hypothetical protein
MAATNMQGAVVMDGSRITRFWLWLTLGVRSPF